MFRENKMRLFLMLWLLFAFPAYADFDSGLKAYNGGDYETAFKEWQTAADQGNIEAQRNLGHLYRWGKGVQQDLTQAAFWYYTAAKGGSDSAQYNLGVMYLRGEGIPRNEEEGVLWLERAAEQNNREAVERLAHLKTETDFELPAEEELFRPVKSAKKGALPGKMTTVSKKEPPLYAHLASYFDQETLEKGWKKLKAAYPELAKFKTLETRVSLQKGRYIRLYIKGKPEEIRKTCDSLNAKKQYCLISYP